MCIRPALLPGHRGYEDVRRADSLQGDSAAQHLDPHLGVDRRWVEAVLAHDDRRDVGGGIDGEQDVVTEELDRDDRSDAVTPLAVRNQGRYQLLGPQRKRRGTIAERG